MADVRFSPGKIKIEIWLTPEEAKEALKDFPVGMLQSPFDLTRKIYSSLVHTAKMDQPFKDLTEELPYSSPLYRGPLIGSHARDLTDETPGQRPDSQP